MGENKGKEGGRYHLWAQSAPGAPSGERRAGSGLGWGKMGASPFNVILLCLVGLMGRLDVVSLAYHCNITLHVALQPSGDVVRVGQDGPLVVELVLCSGEEWGLHLPPPPPPPSTQGHRALKAGHRAAKQGAFLAPGGQAIRSPGPGATAVPASGPDQGPGSQKSLSWGKVLYPGVRCDFAS